MKKEEELKKKLKDFLRRVNKMAINFGDLWDRMSQVKDQLKERYKQWEEKKVEDKPLISPVKKIEASQQPAPPKQTWQDVQKISEETGAPIGEHRYKEFNVQPPAQKPVKAPVKAPDLPIAKPTPLPDKYDREMLSDAIARGFRKWAGLDKENLPDTRVPMIAYSNKFAEEVDKNPLLRKFPFLLPALSILETSGGQHVKFKNNPLNWGIVQQRMGYFNPATTEETIEKAASGISERTDAYKEFRETLDIADLVKRYAPPSENLTKKYIEDLRTIMQIFEGELESF